MKEQEIAKLRGVIREITEKIRRFKDRGLGESNTKASLIEPILEGLGWDIRDPDEVSREFKPNSKDNPVDYSLAILRKPRLLVEAKGLGGTLTDRRWISQVLSYATVAGIEWCVLTDGDEYRFYNSTAPVDAEEKLFCHITLSKSDDATAANTLGLISRSNLEGNLLDDLWSAHFVDRRVKSALQDLFKTKDKALIRLIRSRSPRLAPKEILESLRRLDVRIESETPTFSVLIHVESKAESGTTNPPQQKGRSKPSEVRPKKSGKISYGITLKEIITAGLIKPPIKLFRKTLGVALEATLSPDGTVEFEGKEYASCSTAAEQARSKATGRVMNTNGWSFWQLVDATGKKRALLDVRTDYIKKKGGGPNP